MLDAKFEVACEFMVTMGLTQITEGLTHSGDCYVVYIFVFGQRCGLKLGDVTVLLID